MKNKSRFWETVGIALALPIVFAILDLMGMAMWNKIGGWGGTAYTTAMTSYQSLFWTFAYAVIIAIVLVYYILDRDKSETLAILIIPLVLLQMGAEDVFFYFIGGIPLWTDKLPWLTQNLWGPTYISWGFGEPIITGPIILSAAIGYAVSYLIARQLVKIKP